MDPRLLEAGLHILKNMLGGNHHDPEAMKAAIREEIKKSQDQESLDMLKQMLLTLEKKYNTELQETTLEKEKLKIENEYLKKLLQETKREKKSDEKTEKMKDLLTCMAELSMKNKQATAGNQKHRVYPPRPNNGENNNRGGTLPWLDASKGNFQSSSHGQSYGDQTSQPKNKHYNNAPKNFPHSQKIYKNNFQQNSQPYQQRQNNSNMQQNHNFQTHHNTQFDTSQQQQQQQQQFVQPNQNMTFSGQFQHHQQQQPRYMHNNYVPINHFQQNQHMHKNNIKQNSQPDQHLFHDFQPNQNMTQSSLLPLPNMTCNDQLLQNSYFQQNKNYHKRGHHSQIYNGGRGKLGNKRGNQKRSSSVGRGSVNQDSHPFNTQLPSSSFHIQVTQIGRNGVSTESISTLSDISSNRGRGNNRGRGRGRGNYRGRGRGGQNMSQEGINVGQSKGKKNRKKGEKTRQDHQNPDSKKKNNEGDPEDFCAVS